MGKKAHHSAGEKFYPTALQDSQLFQNLPGSSTTDGEKPL